MISPFLQPPRSSDHDQSREEEVVVSEAHIRIIFIQDGAVTESDDTRLLHFDLLILSSPRERHKMRIVVQARRRLTHVVLRRHLRVRAVELVVVCFKYSFSLSFFVAELGGGGV
jgi:hypothetical protein